MAAFKHNDRSVTAGVMAPKISLKITTTRLKELIQALLGSKHFYACDLEHDGTREGLKKRSNIVQSTVIPLNNCRIVHFEK